MMMTMSQILVGVLLQTHRQGEKHQVSSTHWHSVCRQVDIHEQMAQTGIELCSHYALLVVNVSVNILCAAHCVIKTRNHRFVCCTFVKPLLATACHLFVCLFVSPSVAIMQKGDFLKN